MGLGARCGHLARQLIRCVMETLSTILSVKELLLETRKQRTPQLAVVALADMRARPLPSLNVVRDTQRVTAIGYIPLADTYDPVMQGLRMVRAGVDGLALFTDSRMYSKGLNDLLLLSLGVKHTPVMAFDYPLDEYHVLEMRTAGASAVMLYAALVSEVMLKRMVSIALRVRMTTIIHVDTLQQFDLAVRMSPHAMSIGTGEYFDFQANRALLDYTQQHKPYHMRLMLRPCLSNLAQVSQAVMAGMDAVVLDESLLKEPMREKVFDVLNHPSL